MKKHLYKIGITLPLLLSLASFKVGENVELSAYLNARSSAKFSSDSKNIETQLPKGTRGSIVETQKLPSGNYGLKLKIENGPHANESYWVYYNLKNPLVNLYNDKHVPQSQNEVETAKIAELKKDQIALRDPEEKILLDAAKNANTMLNKKVMSQIQAVTTPKSSDCKTQQSIPTKISEDQYDETMVVEPYKEVASSSLHSIACHGTSNGWDQCKSTENGLIEGFKLSNRGPNKIVKTNEYYISRDLSFEFEDHARSDMKLIVSDSPDDTTSHATYSIMMFFPRTVMPEIKKVGDELEVTLPTKEIVRFNAKTNEVTGGVFTEGAMAQDPSNRNKAFPANIKYTGSGVLIRADKSGDLPYGDSETNSGAHVPSTSVATVSKKGFKDCKIPSKDLWYTDYKKGSNTFIKPELANDAGMMNF